MTNPHDCVKYLDVEYPDGRDGRRRTCICGKVWEYLKDAMGDTWIPYVKPDCQSSRRGMKNLKSLHAAKMGRIARAAE